MAEIKQIDGRPVIDYMARDYQSLLQAMYEQIPEKLPEWKDFTNEADFGNVLLELFAHMGDILSYYQDRVANESFLGTARTRRSVIEHLRLIGYKLSTAVPAAARLSVSVPGTVNAMVTVNKGDAFATKSQKNQPSIRFEYTQDIPLTINFGAASPDISIDPLTGRKTFNSIPVEEGRLIKEEILGISDGAPNQRYSLAHAGLILRPSGLPGKASRDVSLLTQLGLAIDTWSLQETLAFSRNDQKDYVIEIDEDDQAAVIFGDGKFGAIPPNGATIKVTYRVGGGSAGNVPANTIQTIASASALALLGAKVTNPAPANGGAEHESIEHAVQQAPAVFRSLRRAVTASDYQALALSFKGVGKVRALSTGWNRVTLFVAPEGGGKVSDVLEADLIAFFEDKRMLSQIIEIEDVDYVPIFVTAEIGVESYYLPDDVRARLVQAAGELLAFENVDFGQTIYLSKFYEQSEKIEGVLFVNITEFRRGDAKPATVEASGKIELGPNEIPIVPGDSDYAAGIKVVIITKGVS